jgi:predicted DsbA family dithiol-disulfide isomerase
MPEDTSPLHVTVWSDYICPFCHIGRDRAEWFRREAGAEVEWLPYDLHPEYPPEGIPREELARRYPPGFLDMPRRLAEEAGLPYAPHPERIPNSRRALELTEWARAHAPEHHERLHGRIMDAYWSEGRDIGDAAVLAELLRDLGLDADAALEAVASGAHAAAVDASTRMAQRAGISAVPAFVLDGRLLVSGAVPHEVLAKAVEQARAMRAAAPPPSA